MTAPYLTHGATLALAWFLIVNLAASAGAAVAAQMFAARDRSSAFWFALRVCPSIVAMLFVAVVFLPSYWRYEPANTAEGFDVTLTALGGAAVALGLCSIARGAAAWLSAARRERTWMRSARPLGVHAGVPAFEIDADAPMMALVGVVRPRLIVTAPLASALSSDEMQASIAHEAAHWRAWDNLKRLAMRASPDLLGVTSAGRALERRWASAAEHAADDCATGVNPATRCALASALVKIVRLMPQAMPAARTCAPAQGAERGKGASASDRAGGGVPGARTLREGVPVWGGAPREYDAISTLVGGGDIAARVLRLLDDRLAGAPRSTRWWQWAALAIVALTIVAMYPASLVTIHEATETLVQSLP